MTTGNLISNDKPTLILHIGGPKCGSSALQTFLTHNSKLQTEDGEVLQYWKVSPAAQGEVNLIFSPVIIPFSPKGLRYEASEHLTEEFKSRCIHKIFEEFMLNNITDQNRVFMFSSEAWSSDLQGSNTVECNCKVKSFNLVIYQCVRPQIDMLVPSYLQWTLWTENPTLDESFHNMSGFSNWEKQASNAYRLGADKVIVRYPKDIIEDFCKVFKIDEDSIEITPKKRVNKSLPLEAIAFLIRNRELRPGPHDSDIDFLLEDYIDELENPADKLILNCELDLLDRLEKYFSESNLKMFKSMNELQVSAFLSKAAKSRSELLGRSGIDDLSSLVPRVEFLEPLLVSIIKDFRENKSVGVSAIAERDGAIAERDGAIAERDSAIAERDGAIAERDSRA